jgi:hypothetical protein
VTLAERAGGEGTADGFLELARDIHRDDPHWVPEDRAALAARFASGSPWFQAGEGRTLCVPGLARASVYRRPGLRIGGIPAAFFGHWEGDRDAAADTLVMDAARRWARAAGAERLYGPVDLSPAVAHLVRVSGGDGQPPYLGEPYNPPGYAAALEALGLEVDRRYMSAELGESQLRAIGEHSTAARDELEAAGYRFERLTPQAWERHRDEILGLGIFAGNFGAGSVTPELVRSLMGPAWAARLDPEASLLGFGPDGDVSVYACCYPDYGPLLAQGAGDARVDARELSYDGHAPRLRDQRPATLLLKTSGANPRHRRKGVAQAGLGVVVQRALARGVTQLITGPMDSENPVRLLFRGGQSGERTYAIYATDVVAA